MFAKNYQFINRMNKIMKRIPWKAVFKFLSMLFATLAGSAIATSCVTSIL